MHDHTASGMKSSIKAIKCEQARACVRWARRADYKRDPTCRLVLMVRPVRKCYAISLLSFYRLAGRQRGIYTMEARERGVHDRIT
jgi:hypothetical protein